jgi:hypothetical protein
MSLRAIDSIHVVPLLAPVSITGATNSDVVGLKAYHAVKFLVSCGTLAVDLTITVTKSPKTAAAGTAIAFKYRETAAVGTDTMGAWDDALSSGHVLTGTTDNGITTEILVDGAELTPVATVEQPYVFVTLTPASGSACLVGVVAVLEPRYAQAVPPSAVI